MWHGDWQWGAWGWVMMTMMIVFWALVVGGTVYAISALSRAGRGWAGPREDSPIDLLDRRYARGEITREQYQQMRDDLLHRGGGPPSGG